MRFDLSPVRVGLTSLSAQFSSGSGLSSVDIVVRSAVLITLNDRKFDERKILGGIKQVWSNGSTDVAGETEENPTSPAGVSPEVSLQVIYLNFCH